MRKYILSIVSLVGFVFCSEAQSSNYNSYSNSNLFGVNNARQIRKSIQEDALAFNNTANNSNDTSVATLKPLVINSNSVQQLKDCAKDRIIILYRTNEINETSNPKEKLSLKTNKK